MEWVDLSRVGWICGVEWKGLEGRGWEVKGGEKERGEGK